jgi:hypothetical protein
MIISALSKIDYKKILKLFNIIYLDDVLISIEVNQYLKLSNKSKKSK